MKKRVYYEQPLNDRMRNLLRLEHLLTGMGYYLKGPSEWDSRAVIQILIEVLNLLDRIDFIGELTKDLQQHVQTLERWQRTPEVNAERLTELIRDTEGVIDTLGRVESSVAGQVTKAYIIGIVRQRTTIIGGTSRCDMPGYYHWLQKNPKMRLTEMNEWLTPLDSLRKAVELNLYLIRNNANATQEMAEMGVYQSKLEGQGNYQLIQVALPPEHVCYPEMSGGKQRFTIRFWKMAVTDLRPVPAEQDVNFEMRCCML